MRNRTPGRAIAGLFPSTLAVAARCQPHGTDNRSSDGCAGDAAAPVGANADHSSRNSGHNDGPGVTRNVRNSHRYSGDHHVGHNRSLDPGNGRDCFQNGVRDIHDLGRHVGYAHRQVARQRQSTRQPSLVSFFSSCSPRHAFVGRKPQASMYRASAECRPNVHWVLHIHGNPPLIFYRSPLDALIEASGREEALLLRESGPRRGRRRRPCHVHGEILPAAGAIPQSHSPAAIKAQHRASG